MFRIFILHDLGQVESWSLSTTTTNIHFQASSYCEQTTSYYALQSPDHARRQLWWRDGWRGFYKLHSRNRAAKHSKFFDHQIQGWSEVSCWNGRCRMIYADYTFTCSVGSTYQYSASTTSGGDCSSFDVLTSPSLRVQRELFLCFIVFID